MLDPSKLISDRSILKSSDIENRIALFTDEERRNFISNWGLATFTPSYLIKILALNPDTLFRFVRRKKKEGTEDLEKFKKSDLSKNRQWRRVDLEMKKAVLLSNLADLSNGWRDSAELSDEQKKRVFFFYLNPIEFELDDLNLPFASDDLIEACHSKASDLAECLKAIFQVSQAIDILKHRDTVGNENVEEDDWECLIRSYKYYCKVLGIPEQDLEDCVKLLQNVAKSGFESARKENICEDLLQELAKPASSALGILATIYDPFEIQKNQMLPNYLLIPKLIVELKNPAEQSVWKDNFECLNINHLNNLLYLGMYERFARRFSIMDFDVQKYGVAIADSIVGVLASSKYEYMKPLASIAMFLYSSTREEQKLQSLLVYECDLDVMVTPDKKFGYFKRLIDLQYKTNASQVAV
jgi:hypothetical protein